MEPRRLVTVLFAALLLVSVPGRAAFCSGPPASFAGLVKQVGPSVVNISTTQLIRPQDESNDALLEELYRRFYGGAPKRETQRKSLGSGFVISPDGFILTNNHVVENAKDIKVKLLDGTVKEAKLIGADEKTDLALVKIDAKGLPAVKLGDSDALEVGDWVIAIGNPFGLSRTVTAGIVSAKGREIGAGPFDDFIQTDAPINPGNSGGPLFNMAGEVVGINTMINAAAQNIGFAIPVNIAKIVVRDLKESGKVVRGWLGASAQAVTPELAEAFHMKEPQGLAVTGVEKGSPAEQAGLKTGDIILEFGGKKIEHPAELPWMVASSPIGTQVPLKVLRGGSPLTLTATIAPMPEGGPGNAGQLEASLGFTAVDLTAELARQLGLEASSGVVVTQVARDSVADDAGMRPGDIIAEVGGKPVRSADDLNRYLGKAKPGETVVFYVIKPSGALFIPLKLKPSPPAPLPDGEGLR